VNGEEATMRRELTRRRFALWTAGMLTTQMCHGIAWAERPVFRVGVSLDTIADANVNDARAAYRVWGNELSRNLGMNSVTMLSEVFYSNSQMLQMIRNAQVDGFAITGLEYVKALDFIDQEVSVIEDYATSGIDYVVLVKRNSPYQKLEDLRHGKIHLLKHRDTSLLRTWIGLALMQSHLPDAESFFDSVEIHEKVNEVILPLFFGRIQAVGISRRAFSMAAELNPQIGRELRILATSPRIIPAGFWFRKGADLAQRNAFMQAMIKLKSVTAGRQVLALYQSSGFVSAPGSVMNGTIELVHQYERLRKKS